MSAGTRNRWLACMGLWAGGCAQVASLPEYPPVAHQVRGTAEPLDAATGSPAPMAARLHQGPPPAPPALIGPRPVDAFIQRGLAENRLVQAARYNVLALRYRIPQVTSLDDPVVSSTYFPSAENGLQTADGFMPWNLLVAQQFPWFGTLALRGLAAEQDVHVALAELCAAQLDVVESVKLAYFDLHFAEQAERILRENRGLVEDFLEIARIRYETGQTSQQELLSAEVVLTDLDRELTTITQLIESARADLAEQIHVNPDTPLQTLPEVAPGAVPDQIERLYAMAVATRPELKGRLAAVARDATAVDLARKRYQPNFTLGINYGLMTTTGAMAPMAEGNDNLGMFLGFNVPIYRARLDGAVREAQARTLADSRLYEAELDSTFRGIRDRLSQARAQQRILDLLGGQILPRAREALELSTSGYESGEVDFLTLITAWREVLQIELQRVQTEADLGRSLASLERAVGLELNRNPRILQNLGEPTPPAPATTPGPFQPAQEAPATPTEPEQGPMPEPLDLGITSRP